MNANTILNPVVSFRKIRFAYRPGGKFVLNELDMALHEGEIMAVIGPNGAGKSTLIKLMCRIVEGYSGSITAFGKEVSGTDRKALAAIFAYVPQSANLDIPFSVEEFVRLSRYPYQGLLSGETKKDRVAMEEALDITGTARLKDSLMSELSGGEKQLVHLAAAIAQESKVLLLDEPAAFLDPKHQSEFAAVVAAINKSRSTSIVFVTHDINSAVVTSHTILAIHDGKAAYLGPAGGFLESGCQEAVYEKKFVTVKHPGSGRTMILPDIPESGNAAPKKD